MNIKYQLKLILLLVLSQFMYNSANALDYKILEDDILTETQTSEDPQKLFEYCEKHGKFIEHLMPGHLNDLPIGIKVTMGNTEYMLAIAKAEFTSDMAYLTVFCRIKLPQTKSGTDRVIFLGAENILFSNKGGFRENSRLVLLGDYTIPFKSDKYEIVLKGSLDKQTGAFGNLTYLEFDCNGPTELKLSAAVNFSRELLIPLDNNFKPIENANVKVSTSFTTTVKDWNDWLVSVTLPPFCSKNNKKIAYQVQKAVFDFSDVKNADSMVFPPCYNGIYADAEDKKRWRGFYCKQLIVALPKEFKKKNSSSTLSFGAKDLYIDNYGVTGTFLATGLLTISNDSANQGDASGWAMSLDSIYVGFELDRLKKGGLSGLIRIPTSKVKTLSYKGVFTKDNYLITVQNKDSLDFSILKAKMQLYPSSSIIFHVKNESFRPKAILNGQLLLNFNPKDTVGSTDSTKALFRIPKITFQELVFQTEHPFVHITAAGYEGNSAVQRFPITIQKLNFSAANNEIKLAVALRINLMNDASKFSAEGAFNIIGKIDNSPDGRGHWRYDRFEMQQVKLKADLSSFAMEGSIDVFNDDPGYGDGFRGALKLTIKKGGGKTLVIDILTYFGRMETYRYWAVDGMLSGVSIPVFPSFNLTGFGGGAANHMVRRVSGTNIPVMPSSIVYIPDSTVGLTLKASILFNIPQDKVCKGNLTFEMTFFTTGGLKKLGLYGAAEVFEVGAGINDKVASLKDGFKSAVNNVLDSSTASLAIKSKMFKNLNTGNETGVKLQMAMEYDVVNNAFNCDADIYMKVAGDLIKGTGINNKAGSFQFSAKQDRWHIYMGTPSNRLGVRIGIGSINATFSAYFMVGNDVAAASPALPSFIVNLLGSKAEEIKMVRDVEKIESGTAVCLGASMSVSTGNINFLCLYGSFDAGIGFDLMMRKYGKGAHCSGSNAEFGINDWYIMGQTYAYIGAEIGITIAKVNYSIIEGAAAAIMQARFPNPSWFMGYVYGEYDLLGGAYKDNFEFKVEFGTNCNIEYGKPEIAALEKNNNKFIESITPMNEEEDVDVYAKPKVYFNTEINKVNEYEDARGVIKYKLKLAEFSMKYGTNFSQTLGGSMEFAEDMKSATLEVDECFPDDTPILITARVAMYEVKGGTDYLIDNGKGPVADTMKIVFRTGKRPQKISLNNLSYCYPIPNQNYLYIQEDSICYINLKEAQNWAVPDTCIYKIVIKNDGENYIQTATLKSNQMGFDFKLPSQIQPSHYYYLQLLRINPSDMDSGITITQLSDSGKLKTILEYGFGTSQYHTFGDKVNHMTVSHPDIERQTDNSDILVLGAEITDQEPFDHIEITKKTSTNKHMVSIVAKMDSETYFINKVMPLIYPDSQNIILTPGVLEKNHTMFASLSLQEDYLASSSDYVNYAETHFPFKYNLMPAYKKLYMSTKYRIVNTYIGTTTLNNYTNLLNSSFPNLPSKSYQVILQYRLPNGTVGTSGVFNFVNDLPEED